MLACASVLTTAVPSFATARLSAARPAPELPPYPPLMWHSWGLFTHDDEVNEENMKAMGDALVLSGMAAAGYDTVNVVRSRSSLELFFCAPFCNFQFHPCSASTIFPMHKIATSAWIVTVHNARFVALLAYRQSAVHLTYSDLMSSEWVRVVCSSTTRNTSCMARTHHLVLTARSRVALDHTCRAGLQWLDGTRPCDARSPGEQNSVAWWNESTRCVPSGQATTDQAGVLHST